MKNFLFTCISVSCSLHAESETYMQLINKLDRPSDGYCLDLVGSGPQVRFDMPLTAHNCKGPHTYADETVTITSDGNLFFPAYEGCVTVMGNNQTALAGNALMLKGCGANTPFLNATRFQQFEVTTENQIRLKNSDLCIVAGEESHTTYSLEHKWRSLFMAKCKDSPLKLSQWKFISPKKIFKSTF